MSKATPFMFAHQDGRFLQVTEKFIMTEHALLNLIDACEKAQDEKYKSALTALIDVQKQGLIANHEFMLWSNFPFLKGDLDEAQYRLFKNKKGYGSVAVKSVLIAAPGAMSPTFDPDPSDHFSSSQSSWGWAANVLRDHQKVLKPLAAALDITIEWESLRLINKTKKMIDENVLTLRQVNPALDLGAGQSFVLFDPKNKKYLNKDGWGQANLATAVMFESAREAEKFGRRKIGEGQFVVAQIDLHLNAVLSNDKGHDLGPLSEAIAARQKEELEKVLHDLSIEQLKNRLAALEEKPIEAPSAPKKKM